MDYPAIYQRLAQEILRQEGKIGADTRAFVDAFVVKLRKEKWNLSTEQVAALDDYTAAMTQALESSLTAGFALGSGLSMQSPEVLGLMSQAFTERWPDGLTLSDRLWRWKTEARDGVQEQLAKGLAVGRSNSAIVYDMQRAIERNSGNARFKIVSDSKTDWVEELYTNAQAMIHDPATKADWQAVLDEVEAHIDTLSRTGTRNAAERVLSQIKKAVESGNEMLLDKAVKWWTYDQQLFDLNRIVRTEVATAAHRAVIAGSIDDPDVIGYQWRLSASHKVTDICDYYASIEMGLGKGVWTKEAVPRHKAHPHCMCLLIPRATPIRQKGNRDYGTFITNTTSARRAELLPDWANAALKGGVTVDKLLRPDGLGIITQKQALANGLISDG